MGQPFVVENKTGANSFIATKAVVDAPDDGYTLFVASNLPMVTNASVFRWLPYDPLKDFAPVVSLARFAMVNVEPASSSYTTPGKLNFTSCTPPYQMSMEQLHERHCTRAAVRP